MTFSSKLKQPTAEDRGLDVPEVVAHELANLLDGSLRHVNLLLRDLHDAPANQAGEDSVLRQLDTIRNSMHQMVELVHGLKDTSPKQAGAKCHTEKYVPLFRAVQDVIDLVKPRMAENHVAYHLEICEDSRDLPAGPLPRVIHNALLNSLDAIEASDVAKGLIDITIKTVAGQTCLELTDDGAGISSALLDPNKKFIFGISTKSHGQGIGLPLCKNLAASLGGEMTLTCAMPKGTRFTFRYPTCAI